VGIQPVRAVLRGTALVQLAKGVSARPVAEITPLTPQAIRKAGRLCVEGGLERGPCENQRPGAAALQPKAAYNRHGLRRPAEGPCPLDGSVGGGIRRKEAVGSESRT